MSERKGTKALELWCKRLVKSCPNVQIENMTTSWRNGLAFCALVHHFRPDLIDVSSLNPENVYENNQLAFSVAEKHLGIPALLDPEDMVENEVPDRLSILTYLSQFYQRLGHTVNTKTSENESNLSSPSSSQATAPFKFGKAGLDKCASCSLPVYLAQRLIVSHKLYHRSCFRCSKCSGHLNPKNFEIIDGSDFSCDSCKSEKTESKFLNNNNDQMGMLAFSDEPRESETKLQDEEKPISPKLRSKPLSILERINKFENNMERESIESKLYSMNLKDNVHNKHKNLSTSSFLSSTSGVQDDTSSTETDSKTVSVKSPVSENQSPIQKTVPEKSYKTNVNKQFFLQTQLSGEGLEPHSRADDNDADVMTKPSHGNFIYDVGDIINKNNKINNESSVADQEESNITDDIRLAKSRSESPNLDTLPLEENDVIKNKELSISVPPRRKKKVSPMVSPLKEEKSDNTGIQEYPDELNPFSDDEDETEENTKIQEAFSKKVSTNPFGSSDEEDDEVPPIPTPSKTANTTPAKRHITALNPFWSDMDSEEPSSEDETNDSSSMYKTSMATSTPNLPGAGLARAARRKKGRAPPPPPAPPALTVEPPPAPPAPPALTVEPPPAPPAPLDQPCTSMDDVASISSYSSYNSTVHSDQKSFGKITPRFKKRPAPTPPDNVSTASPSVSVSGSMERGLDSTIRTNASDQSGRKVKGPAPGLPLPERREVRLQMSPEELQVQMELLDAQQLGLERQGVLLERMIRDKCEGAGGEEGPAPPPPPPPPEEVEDLVIQLCELVNEKNDLFRKQTELMYIRRQQRLEQEQADIEHEIRVIQSRPAVNRIDADKAREEQLVARLVQVVLLRDELVQQIDAERRRERREDRAIAASIACKRAQRNSGSNSSSMKSVEVAPTPKKNKMKDKVKKQLKKAKHSLISKKKDDSGELKEKGK